MADLESMGGLRESYARWRSSPLGQITDRLEQQLLFELAGAIAGETVLDVGCGDGALASELARRGAIVTGLSFAQERKMQCRYSTPELVMARKSAS